MSFEPFVRPYVVPSIRPAVPQRLPLEDDPEQGIATLGGLGGKLIDLSQSQSGSVSRSHPVEIERTVHRQRIKQMEPDGTVNEENFVDVDTVQEMKMQGGDGGVTKYTYATPPEAPNIETLEIVTIKNPDAPASTSGGAAP